MDIISAFHHLESNLEKIHSTNQAFVGVTFDPEDDHSPFQIFQLRIDVDEGVWYSVEYCGGKLLISECEVGEFGAETLEAFINGVEDEFPNASQVQYFLQEAIDIEYTIDHLMPLVLNGLEHIDNYFPNRLSVYAKLCFDRIHTRNLTNSVDLIPS